MSVAIMKDREGVNKPDILVSTPPLPNAIMEKMITVSNTKCNI